MHQKYMKAFSSSTSAVLMIVLKMSGFSISFSSIFKMISHNFGARVFS